MTDRERDKDFILLSIWILGRGAISIVVKINTERGLTHLAEDSRTSRLVFFGRGWRPMIMDKREYTKQCPSFPPPIWTALGKEQGCRIAGKSF